LAIDKFNDVPIDPDTRVLMRRIVDISSAFGSNDVISALHEWWVYDSIEGESLIIASDDVSGFGCDDILKMLQEKGMVPKQGKETAEARAGYVFVNFGFHFRD